MGERFVSYLRVSTVRQGAAGLGIEAQRAAVAAHVQGGVVLREFVEVESGRKAGRPQLAAALAECRLCDAVLVVAKLDRLARNAAFLLSLRDAGVEFVAADMPSANRITVGILAVVAEAEADAISSRTKAALEAARARGTQLGGRRLGTPPLDRAAGLAVQQQQAAEFVERVGPIVRELHAAGHSLRSIAAALTERGVRTRRGGSWTADAVRRVLAAT